MRVAVSISLFLLLATGCATSNGPRQYLDEVTAATVTVTAKPWVFVANDPNAVFDKRGYLSLYTLDVNHAGSHQPYFAAMQSSFDVGLPNEKSSPPTLEIQANGQTLVFHSTPQDPRQLGLAQPLEQPFASQSRWWYFVVTKQDIAAVAQLQAPQILLTSGDVRFTYVEFRNGSKELRELAAALP